MYGDLGNGKNTEESLKNCTHRGNNMRFRSLTNLANSSCATVFIHARIHTEQALTLRSNLVSAIFDGDLSILRCLGYFISLKHVHDLILNGGFRRGCATAMFFSSLRIDNRNRPCYYFVLL